MWLSSCPSLHAWASSSTKSTRSRKRVHIRPLAMAMTQRLQNEEAPAASCPSAIALHTMDGKLPEIDYCNERASLASGPPRSRPGFREATSPGLLPRSRCEDLIELRFFVIERAGNVVSSSAATGERFVLRLGCRAHPSWAWCNLEPLAFGESEFSASHHYKQNGWASRQVHGRRHGRWCNLPTWAERGPGERRIELRRTQKQEGSIS
mmetsp:Transcript_27870/g.75096  ORF Transcript_27870/g.75096 Transcript_27870/m.75096 type:complete len:208 (+) Transcript_27870:1071-1694(+)